MEKHKSIDDFKVQPFRRPNGSNHLLNELIQTFLSMLGDWHLPERRDEEQSDISGIHMHLTTIKTERPVKQHLQISRKDS